MRHPAHQPGAPHLTVEHLTVHYDGLPALTDISFTLTEGERVAVVGPNGAGKSTLFKALVGAQPITSGSVLVHGNPPSQHVCIAYVPQRNQIDWRFPATVWDVVMMGRVGQLGLLRWPAKRDKDLVASSLEMVDMTALAQRQIGELSGGQQQRVFIARALAQKAGLVLMDEPLNNLDTPTQEGILAILDRLKAQNVTVMVAMHDLNMAADRFERVLLVNNHLHAFGPPADVLTTDVLLRAYGGHIHLLPNDDPNAPAIALADSCCDDEPQPIGEVEQWP